MLYFILGLGVGVYLGTYYNCKPILVTIGEKIKEYLPEKKDDK